MFSKYTWVSAARYMIHILNKSIFEKLGKRTLYYLEGNAPSNMPFAFLSTDEETGWSLIFLKHAAWRRLAAFLNCGCFRNTSLIPLEIGCDFAGSPAELIPKCLLSLTSRTEKHCKCWGGRMLWNRSCQFLCHQICPEMKMCPLKCFQKTPWPRSSVSSLWYDWKCICVIGIPPLLILVVAFTAYTSGS